MAAGHGKRMNSDRPKPLVEVEGKPMVQYILDAITESKLCDDPILVVSSDNIDTFKETIGESHTFAIQEEQLGTGHAVLSACGVIDKEKPTVVLNGDHPTISADMLRKLVEKHTAYNAILTLGVVTVPNFDDWYSAFSSWGRIVRNNDKKVTRIAEAKDSTPEQLEIREVNPNYMCLDSVWMCERLSHLDNHNAQKEYYLTDLVKIAVTESQIIASSPVTPEEGVGVNTPEQLIIAENVLRNRK